MNDTITQTQPQDATLAQEPVLHQTPAVQPTTAPAAALPATSAPASMDIGIMWASLVEMAKDPTIDAAKIEALIGMQKGMYDSAAEKAYRIAKNTAMAAMPIIVKDQILSHNGKFMAKYNKYEDLRKVIDPILTPLGIRINHRSGFNDSMKMPTCECVLEFSAGDYFFVERCGEMVLPLDTGGAKSGAQAAGSSLKYGERYTTEAALGIVTEGSDNDAARSGANDEKTLGFDTDDLIALCQHEAKEGLSHWLAFFKSKSLTGTQKGWLHDAGHYKELTTAATNFGE